MKVKINYDEKLVPVVSAARITDFLALGICYWPV